MITITPEARDLIDSRQLPLYLDMPPLILGGCCVNLQECPTVRFGTPHDMENYVEQEIQGATIFLPKRFPMDKPLTITVSKFLGMKKIVLEGWCPI